MGWLCLLLCTLPMQSAEASPQILIPGQYHGDEVKADEAYYEDGKLESVGNDAPVRILWAGDLDRDRRLDLLLDLSDHYNLAQPTLFLSADAPKGSIVIAVAKHRSTGC